MFRKIIIILALSLTLGMIGCKGTIPQVATETLSSESDTEIKSSETKLQTLETTKQTNKPNKETSMMLTTAETKATSTAQETAAAPKVTENNPTTKSITKAPIETEPKAATAPDTQATIGPTNATIATTTVATAPTPLPPPKPAITPQQFKDDMFRLVNETRKDYGLNTLERAPDIIWKGADIRAKEISIRFDHLRPDGQVYDYTYLNLGCSNDFLYNHLGNENIAYKEGWDNEYNVTAKEIFDLWMNSPGHRANILRNDPEWPSKSMSIGYYFGESQEINIFATYAVLNIN